ncbi:translocation/assembly module TamB domain-containing protein [Reichenbachiella agariperforans]|uniref:translocation/assembly module TamB domain-containing protein n=1 Tax=Reichenbachiella agariperforans TaxID=156994 RepID=UPI001C08ECBB|nr:translocation/assembly module TamB domain-containing protein [Reichenbachiella agariperforans]MBU2913864.1 translocation/assembly module TamB domain-containing protein [Reichenbachiella agariperforans]
MAKKHNVQRGVIFHRITNVLLWIPIVILSVLLVSFAFFQVPTVQTKFINSLFDQVSLRTDYKITVGHTNLTSFDKMHLEDIRIFEKATDSTLISAKSAQIDLKIFDLLFRKQLNADILELESPFVHLIKKNDSTDVNINIFINQLKTLLKKDYPQQKKLSSSIERVEISNGTFSFNDQRRDSIQTGKDYYHFQYKQLLSTISNFTLSSDSIAMEVDRMKTNDPTGQLSVQSFFGKIAYTPNSLSIYNFLLNTKDSQIGDSIVFNYSHPSDFSQFVDKIKFHSHLKRSIISLHELALFNPNISPIHKTISLSGEISGKVKRLKGQDLNVRFGTKSQLRGSASFYGLPNIKETFIDLKMKHSVILPEDISPFVKETYRNQIHNLGTTQFDASFLGFLSDFVADGEFYTDAGNITTDLNFKTNDQDIPAYTGQLAFTQFDLKTLDPESNYLGDITMHGRITGSGLDKKNAKFTLNAFMDSIAVYNYNYKNITTQGHFAKEMFDGDLTISDPNLAFSGHLDIDLHDNVNKIDITAQLDSVHVHKLGFIEKPLSLSSKIDINMKGLKTDELKGYINLYDNQITFENKPLEIDSIKFLSTTIGSQRLMHIETEGLTGEIKGEYKNSKLFSSLSNFAQELMMYLNPDSVEMNNYYRHKLLEVPLDPFEAEITLNLWDLNKFITPFYPSFNLSPNVKIEGRYQQNATTQLSLYTTFDTLAFGKSTFTDNELDFNLSKETHNREVLASMYIHSDNQLWPSDYSSENLTVDAVWFQDQMELFMNLEQEKYANYLGINSLVSFESDEVKFELAPSSIKILNEKWKWDDDNYVIYKDDTWQFSNLKLYSDEEYISINGNYSTLPGNQLDINIHEFSFENIQSLFDTQITGTLDGSIQIQKGIEEDLIESDLLAQSVAVEDFLIGDIYALSHWENAENRLSVSLDLIREEQKKIEIGGHIYPYSKTEQLDLIAQFRNTELKIFETFFKNNISDLTGYADAKLTLKGLLNKPDINGIAKINDGETTIDYLQTRYGFNGEIIFDNNQIVPRNFELKDSERNTAQLSGYLLHTGLRDIRMNISANFKRFKLLNTSILDNDAYYGTAYATGQINFSGTPDNIVIVAQAKSEHGTKIAIPIGSLGQYDIEQQEYIEFVDLSQEDTQEVVEKAITETINKIKGIQLQFDIEMTPDAYIELIFDVKSGDIIRGRGNGNIKLQINSDGDFNMFGDYEIEEGGYNFTLYNIINKEFNIQKGSTISWYGNPYEAQLDIRARYRQITSITPLLQPFLDDEQINSPEARRKYPSIVKLNLKGDLMSPQIKFGIDIEDYPEHIAVVSEGITTRYNLESIISAFKTKIASNEQEMNRQVFSLLILRKFSPENSFEVNSATIGSSLSEFVSNQLSYWATQVDENLEIDVDLAGLGDDAFNTFQLRLSYTFLDGRLRVTRGGSLPNEQTKNDMSTIIGDWTVEYLLTDDGRLRVKMYSRSDLNDINQQTGQNGIETGFSLQYVRSFDELSQILRDSRDKNKKPEPPPKVKPKSEGTKEDEIIL